MKVLIVEPEKVPFEKEIPEGLASFQKEVGGDIEAVYPFSEPVALICNENSKLEGLPYNRVLRDKAGNIYDVIAGTFFLAGIGDEDLCSLTEAQIAKYQDYYKTPEMFLNINGRLVVIPMQ